MVASLPSSPFGPQVIILGSHCSIMFIAQLQPSWPELAWLEKIQTFEY